MPFGLQLAAAGAMLIAAAVPWVFLWAFVLSPTPPRAEKAKPIPKCPPLGYTLSTGQVVVAESDFDGIGTYPLGRPLVVVKCRR